ncbi:FAD-binding oxidoreductase [Microbacterium sp. ZW T5_45]|uniref:FAD-binding oxidoreductase n=1 Tax=Microbacterium sp. ZW T5_45 TaxID=3378080 RepID=UPI003853B113
MSISELLSDLRSRFAGELLLPEDERYDLARLPWNRAIDQRPVAVAIPAHVDDLRLLLATARASGVTLAVQPSGHGASASLDDAIVIRMDAFDDLDADLDAGTVRIGAGVRWGHVVEALEGTGWAAPSGSSPVVTAAGYTLGGGHSWFSRTAGLGSDNLRTATVLRTDGTHERVDDESDPELMWALRGAGGLVAIVTEVEVDLIRTPDVRGATLTFEAEASGAVIRAVRDLAADAPDTLNVFVTSSRMPDAPQLPDAIRGKSFLTVQALSTAGEAAALLGALRAVPGLIAESSGPSSPGALIAQSTEPTEPSPSRGASAALAALDDELIDALVGFHGRPENRPVIGIEIRMLGGALRSPRRSGLADLAEARWLVYALAPLFPGAPVEPGDASLAEFQAIVRDAAAVKTIPTFLSPGKTLDLAATGEQIAHLTALRARFDPEALLHEGRLPRQG